MKVPLVNLAAQYQEGQQNDALIEQDAGGESEAIQIQINVKAAYTGGFQSGFNVNQAEIHQSDGTGDKAYQLQYFSVPGGANIAYVVQEGSDNFSRETQLGGGDWSTVSQVGDGNSSIVLQNTNMITPPTFGTLPTGF